MKIYFDNVNLSSLSGPNSFAQRLAGAFYNRGHSLVEHNENPDVSLVFIEPTHLLPRNVPVVQRLDGIWFKPGEFETKNVNIKRCYKSADAVIWQSKFDHDMITKWWGQPTVGEVVHNGIDLNPVTEITVSALANLRTQYDMMFVCSSNWHPQKRLRDNIEFFSEMRKLYYPNSCLIVMGANPDHIVQGPHIFYTGPQPHQVCLETFSVCNWMIHLAWLDHCPNVVVEAISQGTPVICASSGGTKELVGAYGKVLQEKDNYNFELADYDTPPHLKLENLEKLPPKEALGMHADINIERVAADYERIFANVLRQS